ncbi:hypothetical protein AAVH_14234 [Aphelenchoides avenae]|nr:hypothetical protein AAVH_14234 [Aphelenchus avenae]
MPSTSLEDDDTSTFVSWWADGICWEYGEYLEYRADWRNELRYFHDELLDEKPRLRRRHRDSKWRGARSVDYYNDTIWKALDIRNTYVNAHKFLDTDGRPRNVKWLHEPMLEPLTRDPFSLAFEVPYSLAKKKRWRIPMELRQDIVKFQDNGISLRASLAIDVNGSELRSTFHGWRRTAYGLQAVKEFVSVDHEGKAMHKRSRSRWAYLSDLDRKPLSGKQAHNVRHVQSIVARSISEGHVHPLGKRDPPNERPVHVIYNASEFEMTKHQFNTAERWESCKRYWWYHANRSKNGGRRKASDRWDIADHDDESDDCCDPGPVLEWVGDFAAERRGFSVADYVVEAAPKKKPACLVQFND